MKLSLLCVVIGVLVSVNPLYAQNDALNLDNDDPINFGDIQDNGDPNVDLNSEGVDWFGDSTFTPRPQATPDDPNLNNTVTNLPTFVDRLTAILKLFVPVIIGFALLMFLWGLVKFVRASGDAAERSKGRALMVYGIILIFIMVSVWGLVAFFSGTFFPGGIISDPQKL